MESINQNIENYFVIPNYFLCVCKIVSQFTYGIHPLVASDSYLTYIVTVVQSVNKSYNANRYIQKARNQSAPTTTPHQPKQKYVLTKVCFDLFPFPYREEETDYG